MNLEPHFKNKDILITGASSGIGKEIAVQLASFGARIGLIARRENRLAELRRRLSDPDKVFIYSGDITEERFCRETVDAFARDAGGIDLIINNAGVSMNARFADCGLSVYRQLMAVNYFGSLYMSKFALPWLERRSGGIFFITSIVGKRGFPTRSGYAASKFAVHGLFESIRVELKQRGVYVGILAPGYTATEIRKRALSSDGQPRAEKDFTRGKVMTAGRAAEYILTAIARRKREVILTSGGKLMTWINRLWPTLADRIVEKVIG